MAFAGLCRPAGHGEVERLVDEAARVDDELYMAIRPMLAVSRGTLWLMSTPFGKRGFFYEAWARGGPEWERIQVTAEECPRIPREFLEEERAAMGDRWSRQEYLCEFEDSVSGVFDRALVERAITYEWSLWHTGRPRWTGTS